MDFDIEMEDAAEAFPDQEEAAPQDILPIDNPQVWKLLAPCSFCAPRGAYHSVCLGAGRA